MQTLSWVVLNMIRRHTPVLTKLKKTESKDWILGDEYTYTNGSRLENNLNAEEL